MALIAGVKRDGGRNAGNQFPDVPPVEIHALAIDSDSGFSPVFQRDGIPEDHTDLFKNAHGLVVNALDLLLIQRFDNRQVAGEVPQHGVSALGAGAAAGLTAPALAWTGYAYDQVLSDWKGFGKWKNHPAPLSSAKVTAK